LTEDVYEPLALYRDRFKAEHADNTAAFFEKLVERSGVDGDANAATMTEIRALDAQLAAADSSRSNWKALRVLFFTIVVVGFVGLVLFVLPFLSQDIELPIHVDGLWAAVCAAVAAGGIALIAAKLNPTIRLLDERLQSLTANRQEKIAEAQAQLAPLNRLYDWGMIAKLIQQTVPRLALDPYFSRARLDELQRYFGWDDSFNRDRSVLFAQSGEINGNPFVLAETLDFRMGTKTYRGSITITWQESESYTDSEGRTRTRLVTRTETLTASVDKPAPEYSREKFLIYGNEAAPDLTFSRTPSSLSNAGDGFFSRWRMRRTVAKLEAFSRNLDDEYGYTIMSNRQFAALFQAIDRNDEVQFRLLFTPLAQQQMLNLLRDKTVGFGDNFTFVKDHMINLVRPAHLETTNITADPSLFHNYDLAAARKFFNTYSNAYFRALYFALAPVLTIPLYQQHRSHADIYASVTGKTASFWEHEAIANFHGQHVFEHDESITENLLKTRSVRTDAGYTEVAVTASGFRGENRVDYVSKFGGDGRWHKVPVKWIEYISVRRTSKMLIRETDGLTLQDYEEQSPTSPDWQAFFRKCQIEPQHASFRRSIVSFVSPS